MRNLELLRESKERLGSQARHFAAVADALADRGFSVVLTGSSAEAELTRSVTHAMHSRSLDLGGRTSLAALGAVLRHARLLISNNTGVAHLAAALRVPRVVFYHEPAEVERWSNPDRRHCAVCVDTVDPEVMLAAANQLLESVAS